MITITISGPQGAGKSSIARGVFGSLKKDLKMKALKANILLWEEDTQYKRQPYCKLPDVLIQTTNKEK